jgi:hypothetical protein
MFSSAARRFLSSGASALTRRAALAGAASATAAATYSFADCLKLDITIPVEIDGEALVKALKKFELVDLSSLTKIAKDDCGLMPQPIAPKYRLALVEIYVRGQKYGGSDKSNNGHRYDSIPFANGCISSGMSCQFVHYVHEEHDKFFEVMKEFDAIIVRCNPGQIKADGGSQEKFDDAMRGIIKTGIQVWPSPDVMEFMGAKDALTKIADLNIGLPDTLSYYDEKTFTEGFKKTMAFQPRVIKQNRGSSGEGIWIIKLASGNYCANFGDRSCTNDEVLDMMEANDNHAETHTVGEFIEFCVNGRSAKSGTWTSKGTGKYLEGGKAAGGMLVDQRFCPRIVEGELRYNMAGKNLVGIIHKKPKAGGISAVGGTGSIYTYYAPEEPLSRTSPRTSSPRTSTRSCPRSTSATSRSRCGGLATSSTRRPSAPSRRRRSGSSASSTARASASPSACPPTATTPTRTRRSTTFRPRTRRSSRTSAPWSARPPSTSSMASTRRLHSRAGQLTLVCCA